MLCAVLSSKQDGWAQTVENMKLSVHMWHSFGSSIRAEDAVTWLCVSHICLTHGHLLRGDPAFVCNQCGVSFTILHFLQECSCYYRVHQTFHLIGGLGDILDDCHNVSNTMAFLHGIGDGSLLNVLSSI
jgi:hypothetical protein